MGAENGSPTNGGELTMELNPNHPVTRQAAGQWHKLAAILVNKFAPESKEVIIRSEDVVKLEGFNIVVFDKQDGLHLKLVNDQEAAALVREHGGRAMDS